MNQITIYNKLIDNWWGAHYWPDFQNSIGPPLFTFVVPIRCHTYNICRFDVLVFVGKVSIVFDDIIPVMQFLCSQSWLHGLVFYLYSLASSLTLTYVFIWSNQLCIQLVSFSYPTSKTSVEFVIFFLFLQRSTTLANSLKLSTANLTTAIHFTLLASHKQNLNKLQRIQNSLAHTCHYKY